MPAIRPHSTPTDTESAWDGPAEVAAAPEEEATLRYMHAWVDPDADPDTKTAYKFPHHKAGTDTAANINGVNNALARLPQADIPEADRAGVERHLRAHREDAGLEDEAAEDALRAANHQMISVHEPIRCFEGNAKPHEPFWTWRAAVEEDDEPEIELYGYISEYSWFDDDITPKMFKDDLQRYGAGGPITIRMNSYGGDVIAASLISTFIRDYSGRVTVQIDGVAASAATVVAVAGDRIRMQDTGYFMIHDPLVAFFLAVLNIEELSRLVGSLEAVKEGIINAYENRTGLSRARLSRMMTDETWMDAQKALALGFIDEIIDKKKKKKKQPEMPMEPMMQNAAFLNALKTYRNVPPELLSSKPAHEDHQESSNQAGMQLKPALTEADEREVQILSDRITHILKKGEI